MIKYILTTKDFFLDGPCGRVSHAKGFVDGLSKNKQHVTLICGAGAKDFIEGNSYVRIKEVKFLLIIFFLFEFLFSILKKEKVILRWRPFLPFLFLPYIVFYKRTYFEVNSITGLDSKYTLIRSVVRLSIYLIAKFSKIIVVSENSKKQILSITKTTYPIYVMPNGFEPEAFKGFFPNFKSNAQPNLIYFGKKQEYYDWDNLYQVLSDNPDINLHIFGFNDDVNLKNITFYGKFNHKSLIKEINTIVNPILIIHPDSSEIAKSGSPMKLFEYAYLNVPVIIGDSLSEIGGGVNEFIFYKSGDYESLISTITYVIGDYNSLLEKSASLREKVENNYTWDSIVGRWINYEFKK
ncbi:hypothetical protein GPS59_03900 [Acinetobacter haemolyticus]|uniref:glycosyltransferase n=1 Tax=Acinetobacter haemolyticus TaxID=29430 RepID=UPI001372C914|nr:glycosyltransferase [Acinetobacter haemolyticus]NAR53166.1 hypothetical protein [Acinetobacter haemolyticus]